MHLQYVNKKGYQKLATEQFEKVFDLYSAILIKGISSQLNSGLHHEYIYFSKSY